MHLFNSSIRPDTLHSNHIGVGFKSGIPDYKPEVQTTELFLHYYYPSHFHVLLLLFELYVLCTHRNFLTIDCYQKFSSKFSVMTFRLFFYTLVSFENKLFASWI